MHERDLEDVANEVFLTVYRKLDDYDPTRPVRPWLFAFALRMAADYRPLARHGVELLGDRDAPAIASTGPDARLERNEARELVRRARSTRSISTGARCSSA